MVNLLWLDRDSKIVYRATPKRMRVRDSRLLAKARLDIDKRGLDDADLLVLYNYPVLAYGAAWDRATVDTLPENSEDLAGTQWERFDLSEDDFDNLEEEFLLNVYQAIMLENPHRDIGYDVLKKMMEALTRTSPTSSDSTSENENSPANSLAAS